MYIVKYSKLTTGYSNVLLGWFKPILHVNVYIRVYVFLFLCLRILQTVRTYPERYYIKMCVVYVCTYAVKVYIFPKVQIPVNLKMKTKIVNKIKWMFLYALT